MTDSTDDDSPGVDPKARQAERRKSIVSWIKYIKEHPPEVWGPQQNRLVNQQLEAARAAGLDVEHYERIRNRWKDQG